MQIIRMLKCNRELSFVQHFLVGIWLTLSTINAHLELQIWLQLNSTQNFSANIINRIPLIDALLPLLLSNQKANWVSNVTRASSDCFSHQLIILRLNPYQKSSRNMALPKQNFFPLPTCVSLSQIQTKTFIRTTRMGGEEKITKIIFAAETFLINVLICALMWRREGGHGCDVGEGRE